MRKQALKGDVSVCQAPASPASSLASAPPLHTHPILQPFQVPCSSLKRPNASQPLSPCRRCSLCLLCSSHHGILTNAPSSLPDQCYSVKLAQPPQAGSDKPCSELPSLHASLQPAPPIAPDSPAPACSSPTRLRAGVPGYQGTAYNVLNKGFCLGF